MQETEFNALAAEGYNRIPLVTTLLADLDTPLSIYLKLANAPYSYLLESVVGGERFGRYSFIGLPARTRVRVQNRLVQIERDAQVIAEYPNADPLQVIAEYSAQFRVAPHPLLPRGCGGLVGQFGYETIRYIEKRLANTHKPDALGLPDCLLLLSEELAVVDNVSGKLYLVVFADTTLENSFAQASARLAAIQQQLQQPFTPPVPVVTQAASSTPISEFGEAAFKAAVLQAKEYILAGDIMQVVLSQRMQQAYTASPLALYRSLRCLNPSPYMFYFDMQTYHIVGASPEILVRNEAERITVRPIAGTRPRGKTRADDLALETELLSDPKEIAEHVMLMDLGRNDAGRVSEVGSVHVTDNMVVERYSHVMHIVSSVEGKLRQGLNNIDILRATFPAGTVSGAPKVRAMEIIDELEPTKRGIYAGAVGYLDFDGDMDLAIAIRTGVIHQNILYVQAGAGIVADSIPENEWLETQNKARAVLRAAEIAMQNSF